MWGWWRRSSRGCDRDRDRDGGGDRGRGWGLAIRVVAGLRLAAGGVCRCLGFWLLSREMIVGSLLCL